MPEDLKIVFKLKHNEKSCLKLTKLFLLTN